MFNGRGTIRLIMDMQACQTAGSANRGVGRYSHNLFKAILELKSEIEVNILTTSYLPHTVEPLTLPSNRVIRLPELPDWPTTRQYVGGEQENLDAQAYSAVISPLNSDVIHVSHVFEGFSERVALPAFNRKPPGQIYSATLHDLIPLIYQKHYFQSDVFRKWYLSRLAWLRQADLLLANSESSRQDAINLLGIDSWRIVTIHGGVASHFVPAQDSYTLKQSLAKRFNLRSRFVLYAGGDDYRKNISGAIAAYAGISTKIRRDCNLVIVCAMEDQRKSMYLDEARKNGLQDNDVLITGFISENELVSFYQTCDAFIFPSLYEGLGLPVLEAMACGAPVIGGNNSSIKEIIAKEDALFDADSTTSITKRLTQLLSDAHFSQQLRDYGISRVKDFSWGKSAKIALEAFYEATARVRSVGVSTAQCGLLKRKRLAILTPLPPCRSGIADYNAEFLPYLARHFDVDLYVEGYDVSSEHITVAYRIFNVSKFSIVAHNYDAILYEIGNSEFHVHMLPLLRRFPGVVGLHDAYLSGMYGYIDFNCGNAGSYLQEMIFSHGPRARRFFAPCQKTQEPNGAAMVELPCTKRVLDMATGIISHSPYNLTVAQECYPEGWSAPYRIIPQMVVPVKLWSPAKKADVKKELGFSDSDVLVTTFGHITWTKWGDRLLNAFFTMPELAGRNQVYLIFAGELANDDFGRNLKQSIDKSALKNRVNITGYLSKENFEKYLHISDVAIQLRTKSRGGTPKGVLDCLAHGVPVIVNNDASYTDYPDNVVYKLPADPTVQEIASALVLLLSDDNVKTQFSVAGLNHVRTQHDPACCAAAYASAIHEFTERARQCDLETNFSAFSPHIAACNDPNAAAMTTSVWLHSIASPEFMRCRLFIDVSHISEFDHGTGIQRVVREIVHALYCSNRSGFEPIAVELVEGHLRLAADWLTNQGILLPFEKSAASAGCEISFKAGDVLLMLDSSWARYREFYPSFEKARANGVPIYTVIYDLLPIILPCGNFVDGGREWFSGWFNDACKESDGLICISQAVADDVATQLDAIPELSVRPKIGYWHLGANFIVNTETPENGTTLEDVDKPYLLMVGTIEPRKSHLVALEAMELLWDEGHSLKLCIAGKEGWMVSDLMERLRNHPMLGTKLFLFEKPTDTEISCLYTNAAALLFLSKGEGFGLPLVEAANYGTPIVCSDIPVFHEIAADFATYVEHTDSCRLATDLRDWFLKYKSGNLPDTRSMPRLTWEQSAEELLDVAVNNRWYRGKK